MQPLVSVIVTCYNKEAFIGDALASVYRQTYENIEVVIVNDGSTDDSLNILRSWIPRFNERGYKVNLIDQPNQGIAGAVYVGLKAAQGEYISLLDGDDMYDPAYVTTMAEALCDTQYEWAVCDYRILRSPADTRDVRDVTGAQARWQDAHRIENLLLCRVWTGPNKFMFRMDYMHRCGLPDIMDRGRVGTQEGRLLIPLAFGEGCICHVPRGLYWYIRREKSYSSFNKLEQLLKHLREERESYCEAIRRLHTDCEDRLLSIAKLGDIKQTIRCALRYPQASNHQTCAMLATFVNTHFSPSPDITTQMIIKCQPLSLIYALEHAILGIENPYLNKSVPTVPGGRVVICGALGGAGRFLIPSIALTPIWQDITLWDRDAQADSQLCGKTVQKPNYEGLTNTDTVLIAPARGLAREALRPFITPHTQNVLFFNDIVNYLAATHFPEAHRLKFCPVSASLGNAHSASPFAKNGQA